MLMMIGALPRSGKRDDGESEANNCQEDVDEKERVGSIQVHDRERRRKMLIDQKRADSIRPNIARVGWKPSIS